MTIIDMTTTDGLVAHLQTLPDENLQRISEGPIWNEESAKIVLAAGMILDARKLGLR